MSDIKSLKIMEKNLEKIQPESDDGNKEYKLKLINGTPERIEQWISQMRYRMDEGGGECIYYLGVTDSGGLKGLTPEEYKETISILTKVVQENHYSMTLLSQKTVHNNRKIYEFLIREVNTNNYVDLKIAIAGTVDSGKSTTLGTLISGKPDNGRGSARMNVFNFSHELKSGRTSSMAHHILGFDHKGEVVTQNSDFGKKSWPEIVAQSSKIITFFDLCGHEKYFKTTVLGMTSQFPDLAIITVGSNMGVSTMTKEHMFLCLSLHIPFMILVTKIDICKDRKNVLDTTIDQINKMIKKPPCRRVPITISSMDDVMVSTQNFHSGGVVPIIHTSNVTGQGMDILTQFLNLIPIMPRKNTSTDNVEFHVQNTWAVTGVGTVVGGQLLSGSISVGDKLLLGPYVDGFHTVRIRSIQCKRVQMDTVNSGCYVTLGLQKVDRKTIRKGHVLLSPQSKQISSMEFEAEVSVMKSHSTTIKVGYEPVVHTCSIKQSAKIVDIWDKVHMKTGRKGGTKVLRSGDRAMVRFRFSYRTEYIKPGYRILLTEGKVKVIGKIKNVL